MKPQRSKQPSLAQRLKLETARADDATRQMNEAVRLGKGMEKLWNEAESNVKRMESEVEAANANMAEMGERWKAAETHSKVSHQLLTEAREEIERLNAEREQVGTDYCIERMKVVRLEEQVEELEIDLEHSDADRRQLQRDIEAMHKELSRLQPFNRLLATFPPQEMP